MKLDEYSPLCYIYGIATSSLVTETKEFGRLSGLDRVNDLITANRYGKMRKVIARITWAWGLVENKAFASKKELNEWLLFREEDIDDCTCFPQGKNHILEALDCVRTNLSDYQMDVLL